MEQRMALSATSGAANYVYRGAVNSSDAYTETLMDQSDVVVYISRADAVLNNLLRRDLRKKTQTTMQPKTGLREETMQEFVCAAVSESTSGTKNDKLVFNNAEAAMIHVGDTFIISDLFCDRLGANYSTDKYAALALGYMPENIRVASLTAKSSTQMYVLVIRGNGGNPATPTQITTAFKLKRSGTEVEEDWDARTSSSVEPSENLNYLQIFTITARETEIHEKGSFYYGQTFEQLLAIKEAELLARMDTAFISNVGRLSTINNAKAYATKGLMSSIPLAATARDGVTRMRNNGGAYNPSDFRKHLDVFSTYGSKSRLVLTGAAMISTLRDYHEGSVVINDVLTNKWSGDPSNGTVWSWTAGSLDLNIMAHPFFSRTSTTANDYGRDMLFIDLNQVGLNVYNGMDLQRRVLSERPHARAVEIFCVCGLDIGPLKEAFGYIYGITG
jgi:hypothetical protein